MHLTQEQFSDLIGVGLKAYSAWESGKNNPANIIELASTLEKVTGVDRRWFIGWATDDDRAGGSEVWAPSGSNRRPKDYLSGRPDGDASLPRVADLDHERTRRRPNTVGLSA